MLIAQSSQMLDGLGEIVCRTQQDVDVEDRLRGESRNGRAADVFDGSGERAEGCAYPRAQQLELLRPVPVVVLDDDGIAHSNCLRKAESCCCMSVSSARSRETSSSKRASRWAGGGAACTEFSDGGEAAASRSSVARE